MGKEKAEITQLKIQEFKQEPDGLMALCHYLEKYTLATVVMEATGVNTNPVLHALETYIWPQEKPDFLQSSRGIILAIIQDQDRGDVAEFMDGLFQRGQVAAAVQA